MAGAERMHGMATGEELDRLRAATGRDAEVLFLQLMIRHHEGGVLMSRAVIARSTRDEVVTLATGMEQGQAAEITQMQELLAARGAAPLPSLLGP
jgi:uncharacterized protein (DUF305 family)